jgi:hypothetical protein
LARFFAKQFTLTEVKKTMATKRLEKEKELDRLHAANAVLQAQLDEAVRYAKCCPTALLSDYHVHRPASGWDSLLQVYVCILVTKHALIKLRPKSEKKATPFDNHAPRSRRSRRFEANRAAAAV